MGMNLKRAFGRAVVSMMGRPWMERPFRSLAYHHKRALRRRTEAKLRRLGLLGDVIQSGPFKGLRYPPEEEHWISCRFEKTIGCYEMEMHPWIERAAATKRYTSIINAGAADGTFIVGLGMRFPEARLYAFEPSTERSPTIEAIARLNDVADRLTMGKWCDPEALRAIDPGEAPLVFCDVDGYEEVLMDKASVPWLERADILLEVHEFRATALPEEERLAFERRHSFLRRDIGRLIRSRFDDTHMIEERTVSGVPYEAFPLLENLSMPEILALTESDRSCIHPWFFMERRALPH